MTQAKAKQPLVAIITRTKDRPFLLERALQSVLAQTMTDFEMVIYNDGGEALPIDDLLARYKVQIDGRVKVIHNKEPGGMDTILNRAIAATKSTCIAVHDDDDTWHSDFLARTTEHLAQSGAMGVVVTADRITERIDGTAVTFISKERWLPDMQELNLYKQCLDNYVTPIAFLYRRSAYEAVGRYDESLPYGADWEYALRFLARYDIDFLDAEPALANYHHRPDASGIAGNSVFAQAKTHRRYINKITNDYLRRDVESGSFGLGYIMNNLRYERDKSAQLEAHILEQVVRLEGHVNLQTEQVLRDHHRVREFVKHKVPGAQQVAQAAKRGPIGS